MRFGPGCASRDVLAPTRTYFEMYSHQSTVCRPARPLALGLHTLAVPRVCFIRPGRVRCARAGGAQAQDKPVTGPWACLPVSHRRFDSIVAVTRKASHRAWFWRNGESSDMTLLVYPAGDGPDGVWTSRKPEPLDRLPLHVSVMAFPLGYYRSSLTGLRDKGPGTTIKLTCYPGEPETVPVAVMRHVYTRFLPDDPHLLTWMVLRADDLGMPVTVTACLTKLQAMAEGGMLTVQDLAVIYRLPALQTGGASRWLLFSSVAQLVEQITAKVLASQLGVARQVVVDQQLLRQFVQLPLPLLKQWATLRSTEIDSENTMAVLFTVVT